MPDSSQPSDHHTERKFHLIFLPGLHGTAELFGDLLKHLNLLTLDFQSTLINYPPDQKQSYKKLFKWLHCHLTLDKKNTDLKTAIIAESFSTPLALMLADKFPQQIRAVVIAGGFCASPANPGLALLPLRTLFVITPPRSAVRHFLAGSDSSPELVNKIRSTLKKSSSKNLTQRIRSILTLEEDQTPIIPNTSVLLLQAEHDAVIPWEIQNQLEQHLPHAQTLWLDTPHPILQTHPETCASRILEFLNGASGN